MKKHLFISLLLLVVSFTTIYSQEEKEKKPKEGWHLRGYYTLSNVITDSQVGDYRKTFNEIGLAVGWRRNRIRLNVKYTWDLQISKFQEYSLLYGREIPIYNKLTLDVYLGLVYLSETEDIIPKPTFGQLFVIPIRTEGVLKYKIADKFYTGLVSQFYLDYEDIWFIGLQIQYKL